MSFSNSPIEFTKNVLIEGYQNEPLIKEGQWFTIKCKRLFDSLVLSKLSNKISSDLLIGFTCHGDDFIDVRMRLGKKMCLFQISI
jgi:hypothetical protein